MHQFPTNVYTFNPDQVEVVIPAGATAVTVTCTHPVRMAAGGNAGLHIVEGGTIDGTGMFHVLPTESRDDRTFDLTAMTEGTLSFISEGQVALCWTV